jgi:uncharacterized membrane protein YfcA
MELFIVSLAALVASGLTLFSGFGLGTLLMPVFALFVPLELAVAMTAVVHLANNLFKVGLLGRRAEWPVVLRFGLPAVAAAFAGALVLVSLGAREPLAVYQVFGREQQVSLLGLVIGALILLFVVLELLPVFARVALDRRWLPLGGLVSGFFGGLSGHQGAFRSMFLVKAGLDKEAFVATAPGRVRLRSCRPGPPDRLAAGRGRKRLCLCRRLRRQATAQEDDLPLGAVDRVCLSRGGRGRADERAAVSGTNGSSALIPLNPQGARMIPEHVMHELSDQLSATLKAMAKAKSVEEKKQYSEIVKNLSESLGVFLGIIRDLAPYDFDEDDEEFED